jgi:hypothetical protein
VADAASVCTELVKVIIIALQDIADAGSVLNEFFCDYLGLSVAARALKA